MIVQLPNGETAEFPDDMPIEEIERVLAQQFPKEERGIVSKAAELALQRPFEVLTSPFSAAYHGFWKGSEEEPKEEISLIQRALESGIPLLGLIRQLLGKPGKEMAGVISAPYRPLEEKYPEFITPSKIAGIEGLAGLPLDILADPLLPIIFGPQIAGKIGRMKKPTGLISKYFREPIPGKLPPISEFREPTIIPPEVPSPPTWVRRERLPMVIEKPELLPKPLFEFKPFIDRKVVGPKEIMGVDLAEGRIGKPLKVEVASGEGIEKIFRLKDKKTGKIYAEVGIIGDTENGILKVNRLDVNIDGIEVGKRKLGIDQKTFLDMMEEIPEYKPIKGLFEHVYNSLENYAKENNYRIITSNEVGFKANELRNLGFADIPVDQIGKIPYKLFKRIDQNIKFTPDFNQKLKTLKISEEIGFLNAQKASEINDMASRRSMLFDVSPNKEYVFFDKFGKEINRFKNINEAEDFVKGIKITPSDYWITQQARFKRAEKLYRKTVEQTAAKNIDEAMKYPKGIKEIIAPTYRKFIKPEIPGVVKPQVVTKVDEAINSINSVFDTGTGEIVALGNKVIPIRESLFNVLKSIKEVPNDFYERIITVKGWLKTPQQFFEQQPDKRVKEIFYRRVKFAEKNMTVELGNLRLELKQLSKSLELNNKNFDRIGTFAIAQDENGLRTLQIMKKEIPVLTENETQFYNFIRSKYEEFFNRINEAREFVGIKPIDYRGDYFTFFRNYDELEKLGYHITDGSLAESINQFVHKSSTVFMHEKIRKGGIIPLETNAFDVFSRYATRSVEHIHMTPAVGINRALLKDMVIDSKSFSIKDNAPRFYTWMNKWLDDIAGQRATTELPHSLERVLNALNRNIVFSMLSYNLRSAVIQPSALVQSFTELGPKYLMRGIVDWLKAPKMSEAMKKSQVLLPRQYEQSVVEAFKMVNEPGLFTKFIEGMSGEIFPSMRKVSRGYKGGKQVLAKIGMKPLQFLDMQSAKITWEGAYQKAKNYLKLAEGDAINYADDVVIKTQASGRISDISAAQRAPLGKTLFLLQTFVINNWNYLTKNVLGVSNPNMKNMDRFEKIMKFIIGVNVINFLFEDVMGTFSPFPTPVKAFLKERERGGSIPSAMLRSTREMAELIPGPGGAIRYGSHPGGPLTEVIGAGGRKLAGRIEYKRTPEILAMLYGIPATSQIKKIYTGEKYGAGPIESILGMIEPPEKRPTRKQREKRR